MNIHEIAELLRPEPPTPLESMTEIIGRSLRADPHFYDLPIGGTYRFWATDGTEIIISQLGEEISGSTSVIYYDSQPICFGLKPQAISLDQAAAHIRGTHGDVDEGEQIGIQYETPDNDMHFGNERW